VPGSRGTKVYVADCFDRFLVKNGTMRMLLILDTLDVHIKTLALYNLRLNGSEQDGVESKRSQAAVTLHTFELMFLKMTGMMAE
jgi:hypothetical protein